VNALHAHQTIHGPADRRSPRFAVNVRWALWAVSVLVVVAAAGCTKHSQFGQEGKGGQLAPEDKKLQFGANGISILTEVDDKDPSSIYVEGTLRIDGGRIVGGHEEPGGVLVVCVKEGWTSGSTRYEYGHILLRNSKRDLVLAPPGTPLTIPHRMLILGRLYDPGTVVVPESCKFADHGHADALEMAAALPGHWRAERHSDEYPRPVVTDEYFGPVSKDGVGSFARAYRSVQRGQYVVSANQLDGKLEIRRMFGMNEEDAEVLTLSEDGKRIEGLILSSPEGTVTTTYRFVDPLTAPR
jgi:hypothetical protein